jgi:hypothetical protein
MDGLDMLRITAQLNAPQVADALCILPGSRWDHQATRTSMSGVASAPVPILWDERKG